jgi:hypothetical protein
MKCAIMQPHFLPWSGYFNLIASVDTFVFLDDVQFEKQSWQTRNRILLQGEEYLLVLPTKKAPLATQLADITTSSDRGDWRQRHLKTLTLAYGKSPHGKQLIDLLEPLYTNAGQEDRLAEFNMRVVQRLSSALRLQTTFIKSSTLSTPSTRTLKLISICQQLSARSYLSPAGARDYLTSDGFIDRTSVDLTFQDFVPRPYAQTSRSQFLSHLSMADVIAHLGVSSAAEYIQS